MYLEQNYQCICLECLIYSMASALGIFNSATAKRKSINHSERDEHIRFCAERKSQLKWISLQSLQCHYYEKTIESW